MILLLILPLILFLPDLGCFIFSPGSTYSDLLISHYPNAIFLRQVLQNGLTVPLWSPNILSGYPFAADPLAGLWYPPGWLSLFLPLPLGFNLIILLHLLFGGAGLYMWMKSKGMTALSAIVGGLTFEMMPKLVSHFAAGHITLVYAVAWTPWLLWAEETRRNQKKWRTLLTSPGIVLGVICLADVRWAVYAGLVWAGYSFFSEGFSSKVAQLGLDRKRKFLQFLKIISHKAAWLFLNILIAILIAAPLLFPLVEFIRLSTRMAILPQESFTLSLPPNHLLGLLFPDPGGYAEWILYPGAVALILLCVAIFSRRIRCQVGFWLWVLVLSLVFSLGSAIPFLTELAKIPGFGLLRVPPRVLFLAGLAFSIISCYSLNDLLQNDLSTSKRLNLSLVGFAGFIIMFASGIMFLTGGLPFNFGWGAVCIVVTALILILRINRILPGRFLAPGLIFITLINLGVIDGLSIEPRTIQAVLSIGAKTAQILSNEMKPFRIYSPSYSIPQQTAVNYGLELADGIDPLQLASYVKFMEKASGIPNTGYSVTLPPYSSADPQNDNRGYLPDATLLGELNIKYIAADYDLPGSGLILKEIVGNTRIYENPKVLPRAWIQKPGTPLGQDFNSIDAIQVKPNHITITAKGPGLLVLSELNYPGWESRIDDHPQSIELVNGLFRGVELPPGVHQVEFVFRPLSVLIGVSISLFTWCLVTILRKR